MTGETEGAGGERMAVFHCPYCGEEDLFPREHGPSEAAARGAWECRGCLRVFRVTFLGLAERGGST